ncbi:Cytochrome c, mono-and diheme variants [Collimonas sp. OK607]|uniref:c-type cytochrome n=1 Tax=Collimonas sp. OK607 TaxID=1798194 RepID=UPI0008EF18F0|nr:cytochrome c [Collimonas sp. OK607]SFA75856.1 Cytochrome c, mono-and diheme variants [Collimonas sp. OK607]
MKLMTRLHVNLGATVLALASFNVCAATPPEPGNADLVKRGEYLATAGDCIACHTAPGRKSMAGGLSLPTPLGPIVSTNITPSKTYGIGNYTLEQFSDALRKGIRADGRHLYPAMPYTSYAKVTDDDVQALYAYFMQAVAPVDAAAPATALPFPFNIRLSMAGWNLLFLDKQPFTPDAGKSAEWNRGAYLTLGLAHCSTCHTPRNMLMAENLSRELGGGEVGVWHAPNITSDATSGIGGWSEQEIVDYMHVGHTANKAQAAGPMAEAVDNSLRHLSDGDLRAIATYLKSVPAQHDAADTRATYAWGAAADDLNSIRGVALPTDPNQMTGPQLYDAQCATCHQARGQGSFDGGLPPLFHNTALGRTNTNNLVMVVLEGIQRKTESSEVVMPGFKKELSDQQIATLGNYLTRNFGNPAAVVSVDQVKTLRAGGSASNLVVVARVGIGAFIIVIIAAIFGFNRRKRRNAQKPT